MVPVLMHTPPTTARDSTTATRFFILEAATAARCPEGPEPMTVRSYLTALMQISPQNERSALPAAHPAGNRSNRSRKSLRREPAHVPTPTTGPGPRQLGLVAGVKGQAHPRNRALQTARETGSKLHIRRLP